MAISTLTDSSEEPGLGVAHDDQDASRDVVCHLSMALVSVSKAVMTTVLTRWESGWAPFCAIPCLTFRWCICDANDAKSSLGPLTPVSAAATQLKDAGDMGLLRSGLSKPEPLAKRKLCATLQNTFATPQRQLGLPAKEPGDFVWIHYTVALLVRLKSKMWLQLFTLRVATEQKYCLTEHGHVITHGMSS